MVTKKEEIIKWLKQFKRLSSSRFVGFLGIDYDSVKKLLEELEKLASFESANLLKST